MKAELDQIRELVAKLEAERPGLAKASTDPKCMHRSKLHTAFVSAIDHMLLRPGWSLRALAQHMSVDRAVLSDWLERGDQKSSQIPGWAIAALPTDALSVFMRHMLAWADAPIERTGTDG